MCCRQNNADQTGPDFWEGLELPDITDLPGIDLDLDSLPLDMDLECLDTLNVDLDFPAPWDGWEPNEP